MKGLIMWVLSEGLYPNASDYSDLFTVGMGLLAVGVVSFSFWAIATAGK